MTSARLPAPRGPLSTNLLARLRGAPDRRPWRFEALERADPWGEDLQLALYATYELRYRGFDGVDSAWELDPGLHAFTTAMGDRFLAAVRQVVGPVDVAGPAATGDALVAAATAGGPSLSRWVAEEGTLDHLREFAVHRSAYQLKEADPHSLALPRLPAGRAKAAFVRIQADEYGNGRPGESHQELFAATLRVLALDDGYGAYVDLLPGPTLATVNLVSLFGSSRGLLGACVGHLALFEMTSVGPMARYARAVRRLTGDDAAARFYDVHVVADQLHARAALQDLVVPFVEDDPARAADVVFGARALAAVESRFTAHVLGRWTAGRTSLRSPAAEESSSGTAPGRRRASASWRSRTSPTAGAA